MKRPSSSGDRAPASGAGRAGSIPAWGTRTPSVSSPPNPSPGSGFGAGIRHCSLPPNGSAMCPTSTSACTHQTGRGFDSCLGHQNTEGILTPRSLYGIGIRSRHPTLPLTSQWIHPVPDVNVRVHPPDGARVRFLPGAPHRRRCGWRRMRLRHETRNRKTALSVCPVRSRV